MNRHTNNLRVDQIVEVRSEAEILGSLDENGALDGMPFMPEMLKFCGQRFRVFRSAHKTCDTIECKGLRRLENAVHLEGLRCDGAAHGGCQASCMLFWKEAWLKRVDGEGEVAANPPGAQISPCTIKTLQRATCRHADPASPEETVYSCQATRLLEASVPLPWWNPRQYIIDVASGNFRLSAVLKGLLVFVFNRLQHHRNGRQIPHVEGKLKATPKELLDVVPGEVVEVKSKLEIMETLNVKEKNRGLSFDAEMVPYCGGQYKVLKRVEKIINERTGKMMVMRGDCIMLDSVTCQAHYHVFCPRSIYPYWREIWLRRPGRQSGVCSNAETECIGASSSGK